MTARPLWTQRTYVLGWPLRRSPDDWAPCALACTTSGGQAVQHESSIGATVTVIIPALNEAENLQHVLPFIPTWVHEVVLVDDHSTDATVEVARDLMPSIRIVANERPGGKGNAMRTGFEAATGDIIVMLDADGSESPAEISAFVGALLAGADYAKGSRFMQGGGTSDMTLLRRSGNRVFVTIVRVLFGGRFSDLCYGYNAFWSWVVPVLDLDCEGFEIEAMLNIRALRAGLKIAEIPSFETERVHGVGRLVTFPDGWRVLRTIFRERFSAAPLAIPRHPEHASSLAAPPFAT
jgi:glycosyltransferase involved in cell wall biosynthesis